MLNQKTLAAIQPGQTLRDATVTGLHVRALKSKTSYYLSFTTRQGKRRCPRLGAHPDITLADARALAKRMLLEVAAGSDPVAAWTEARQAPTVADLCEKYAAEHLPKKKSGEQDRAYLAAISASPLGIRKVSDVAYVDVEAYHRAMAHKPYAANRALAVLSKMFNLAERWGWRRQGENPCKHVDRFPENKRKRYATPAETKAIAESLQRHKAARPQAVLFVWLLILTGARKSEIAAARWEWLDGNVLRLPDSKTGARDVYLPDQVMALLEEVPRIATRIVGIDSPRSLWDIVRVEAGCPDLRLHDLRHSFASVALGAGLSLAQIGELLGHRSTQTTARYAHLIEDGARRAVNSVASSIEDLMK